MLERGETDSRSIDSSDKFRVTAVCDVGGTVLPDHWNSISLTQGPVTAQSHRDEVLEPYARVFRGAVGPDFIFMDHNVSCHRVVLIDDFLEAENTQRMSWPANSPDLNSIEHLWDMLGRQIVALSHPPSSVTELKRALQEAWNRLSPQLIHHLIASMINCSAVCLAVRGDHTPY
ncbi:transposable element Tc3 transposase [Trichonephila clavipes]|nr:transposable element Tc3 transposase [Trichonephila clavipes]